MKYLSHFCIGLSFLVNTCHAAEQQHIRNTVKHLRSQRESCIGQRFMHEGQMHRIVDVAYVRYVGPWDNASNRVTDIVHVWLERGWWWKQKTLVKFFDRKQILFGASNPIATNTWSMSHDLGSSVLSHNSRLRQLPWRG